MQHIFVIGDREIIEPIPKNPVNKRMGDDLGFNIGDSDHEILEAQAARIW